MSLDESIKQLKTEMQKENVDPSVILPEKLFLFSTTLSPVVNVDLIITNASKQVLFTWRDDPHNGSGWHIPGSCIHFKETIEESIQRCAKTELGSSVTSSPSIFAVVEHIINYERPIEDQNERAHFITLAYHCTLPDGYELKEGMKWFDDLPDNLVHTQDAYRKHWKEIKGKL